MLKQIICQFNSFQRFFIAIVSKLSHKLLSSSLANVRHGPEAQCANPPCMRTFSDFMCQCQCPSVFSELFHMFECDLTWQENAFSVAAFVPAQKARFVI